MQKIMLVGASLGLLVGLSAAVQAATLVYNVNGYTLNAGELQRFTALEYDQGRVTKLYPDAAGARGSKASERIDGEGATLLPGLIDAHGHVSSQGRALASIDLVGAASASESAGRVAAGMAEGSSQGWIYGRGWNQVLWPDKQFPTRQVLDEATGDRAAVMGRVDGHALWVNSKALELAGINDDTPNPEGGQIIRDAAGAATGVLVDNAMALVFSVMPAATDEQVAELQALALADLARVGLTSVHDAGISAQEVRAFEILRDSGRLKVRVYGMLDVLDPANDVYLEAGPTTDDEQRLSIISVKVSADGALGSRGAALVDDYSDESGNKGLLLLTPEQLEHHMSRAVKAGFQVNTHAIGDHANARVLDMYERLNSDPKSARLRHRVEHAQVLRPNDIKRFAALDVIASIQPTHATSDKNMAGDRLGEERLRGAYIWQTLLDSGARLAGGSDFPVEPPNPLYGLYAAVTRQDFEGQPPGGWMPKEKMSREAALALFTEGSAYAAHQEGSLGRLLPGYYADFILLKDDYFTVPASTIWQLPVLATYVAGERVYPVPAAAH